MHKIVFYGLILLQFDNSNQIMQDQIQKLRQSSIVFEKPVILSGKVKTLTSSNYHTVKYFAGTSYTYPTNQCVQKCVQDFFYFVQILSYLQKLKRPGLYTLVFYIFNNNSISKQNK